MTDHIVSNSLEEDRAIDAKMCAVEGIPCCPCGSEEDPKCACDQHQLQGKDFRPHGPSCSDKWRSPVTSALDPTKYSYTIDEQVAKRLDPTDVDPTVPVDAKAALVAERARVTVKPDEWFPKPVILDAKSVEDVKAVEGVKVASKKSAAKKTASKKSSSKK